MHSSGTARFVSTPPMRCSQRNRPLCLTPAHQLQRVLMPPQRLVGPRNPHTVLQQGKPQARSNKKEGEARVMPQTHSARRALCPG